MILVWHFLILAAAAALTALSCHWIGRQSFRLGAIVAAGLVVRTVLVLGMFFASYYRWPVLQSLQAGDGFWVLAPDARVYYALAAAAAHGGSVDPSGPSPTYTLALSLWLRATGTTMLSAAAFNIVCYAAAALAICAVARRPKAPWLTVALLAVSFSPVLLLTGTQVLKDALFLAVIVLAAASASMLFRYSRVSVHRPAALARGLGLALFAVAAIAGIRPYYAVFVWMALGAGLVVALFLPDYRRPSFVAFSVVSLVLLWGAFIVGAGAYYPYYGRLIAKITGLRIPIVSNGVDWHFSQSTAPDLESVGATLVMVREGFADSAGATNFARRRALATRHTLTDTVADVATGVAAVFVPISLLQGLSIVSFRGGHGFLAITDIDTLFLDATLAALGFMLWRHRTALRRNAPTAVCLIGLTIVATVVIPYLVTNFGTLFRLRIMIAGPAWMTALALDDDGTPRSKT